MSCDDDRARDLGEIPAGFATITAERGWLVVRSDKIDVITANACRSADGKQPSPFAGRVPLHSLPLPGGDIALIRSYRHGGLFRRMTGRLYCSWPPRPFRELSITETLRRRGIATIEPYGAYVECVWGPFYRGWLVTRELTGAQDLWQAFQSGLVHRLGLEAALRAVAESLRALHRAGVYHPDLNLKNVLVRGEGKAVQAYVIDFDRAKLIRGALPRGLAVKNLNRLLRSVNKLDPQRSRFRSADWDALMRYYDKT